MTFNEWDGSFADVSARVANHLAEIALVAVVAWAVISFL